MNLIFAVYSICLFSYYFALANAAFVIFDLDTIAITLMPIMAAVLFVSYLLRTRKYLKYFPLIIGFAAIFIFTRISVAFLLPPVCFLLFVLYSNRLDYMLSRFSEHFLRLLKSLPFIVVFPLLFQYKKAETYLLPYVIICLGCGFLALRMIRHDEKTIASLRFKLLNIASVCLFLIAGYLLSTEAYIKIAGEVLGFTYNNLIAPILILLAYIISILGSWIIWLFSLFKAGEKPEQPDNTPSEFPDFGLGERAEIDIGKILIIVVAIVATIIIFYILKKISKKSITKRSTEGVLELRERIEETEEKNAGFGLFAPTEPRKAIRYYYRKFLLLCLNKKLPIRSSHNSMEVQKIAANEFNMADLIDIRQVYIPARYDNKADIGKDDVKKIKSIYKALKSTD